MDTSQQIVELSSSSDDDLHHVDDNNPRTTRDRTQMDPIDVDTFQVLADEQNLVPGLDQDAQEASYESCLKEVTEVFPDISRDHVQQLYDKHRDEPIHAFANGTEFSQSLIEQILDAGKYPKEKDRLREIKELKRKREDPRSPEEEAARWKNVALEVNPSNYTKIA